MCSDSRNVDTACRIRIKDFEVQLVPHGLVMSAGGSEHA